MIRTRPPAGTDSSADPGVPLALAQLGHGTAATGELREPDEGVLPGPPLVVAALVPDRGREVAERFELLVDRESHGKGGLRRPRDLAAEHEVERPHCFADAPRQGDTLRREMRAFAARVAF